MKNLNFSEPISALECLVQATLEDDLAQKLARERAEESSKNTHYPSELFPPFARKCRNRECNNLSGQEGKPRSLYCSKRCQSREQNLRQGRIKNVKKTPKPFFPPDTEQYGDPHSTSNLCSPYTQKRTDFETSIGKRCLLDSRMESARFRGLPHVPLSLANDFSLSDGYNGSPSKRLKIDSHHDEDSSEQNSLSILHKFPPSNSLEYLYHSGKQLFELRSSEIDSKTSQTPRGSVAPEAPESQAVSEIINTLPSISPENIRTPNFFQSTTISSITQTSNLSPSTSSSSLNSTLLPSICSEHPKNINHNILQDYSKKQNHQSEDSKYNSQICSAFALPSKLGFSNSEFPLLTH